MTEDITALQRRISSLESRVRRRTATAALLVAAVAMIGAFDPAPSRVEASSFDLVDASGAVVGALTVKDGAPGLFLRDDAGRDRAVLVHDADGTGLFLYDAAGTTRVGVAQFAHGGGGVAMHGPDSKGATVLYHSGSGSLRFFDDEGTVTNQVTARPPAEPRREARKEAANMSHVRGIGGIFIESDDPAKLAAWYREVLGIAMDAHPDGTQFYHVFWTRDFETSQPRENPIFAIQPRSTPDGITGGYTLGFRVDDMDATLGDLRDKGVDVDPNGLDWERGRHRRIKDLDGNVIELYQEIGTPPLPDDAD